MTTDNLKILMYEADNHFVRLDTKDGTVAIGTYEAETGLAYDINLCVTSVDFLINALTNVREAIGGASK